MKCPNCNSTKFKKAIINNQIRMKCLKCGYLNIKSIKEEK